MASVHGLNLFKSVSTQGQYLFKGGICSRVVSIQGWYLFKAVSTQGWYLFKGGICSRVVSVQGWYLFKGGICSRVVFIESNDYSRQYLFKSETVQGQSIESKYIHPVDIKTRDKVPHKTQKIFPPLQSRNVFVAPQQ